MEESKESEVPKENRDQDKREKHKGFHYEIRSLERLISWGKKKIIFDLDSNQKKRT
jgi:hypothetical protein